MATDDSFEHALRDGLQAWLDPAAGPHPDWTEAPAHTAATASRTWLPSGRLLLLAATLALVAAIGALALLGGRPSLPVVLPGETPSPSASISPSPTVGPSATPTPSFGPTATPTPSATATPLAGFTCELPLTRAWGATIPVNVSDVRVGAHAGYDRIVFQVDGALLPDLRIERAAPPFQHDPSGLPMTVAGEAFLRVVLDHAEGHNLSAAQRDQRPGYPALAELSQQGDYEGVLSFYVGLSGGGCLDVTTLQAPARLVIDIQQPPAAP